MTFGMIPITAISCYIFILAMRACACCIIWTAMIFSLIILFASGIAMCFFPPTVAFGIISLISFGLMLIFLICYREKINVAIILAKVAA